MTTKQFVENLRRAPDDRLQFLNGDGHAVHPGYHLTEVKAVRFDTVDCGGKVNRWDETIVQLWVPANADGEYMTAGKFLRIFDKVTGMIPLNVEAEIRIEYGDENFFPSNYHVAEMRSEAGSARVFLEPPSTTCKARDRQEDKIESEVCCEAACC